MHAPVALGVLLAGLSLAACSSKAAPSGEAPQRDAGVSGHPAADGGGGSAEQQGGSGGLTALAADGGKGGAAGSAGHAGSASGGAGAAGSKSAAGAPSAGTSAAVSCERCSAYAQPQQLGSVQVAELDGLSGLAASRAQPGILFAHNDHDRPVVYALDLQGRLHARISLQGATASDIEDIALGPCGTERCVYLADIGDNAAQRSEYALLRFSEPQVPDAPGSTALSPSFERYRFTYEDGSHNAESLLVAPDGTLYIISKLAPGSGGAVKATGPSSVYKLDPASLRTTQVARATKLTTLGFPKNGEAALSAAAAHPCNKAVLIRTYDRVYELLAPDGSSDFDSVFSAMPKVVAMPDEPQSEGIDYQGDGRGFITSGEGANAPIFRTDCAL